jgi:hypothetical protein
MDGVAVLGDLPDRAGEVYESLLHGGIDRSVRADGAVPHDRRSPTGRRLHPRQNPRRSRRSAAAGQPPLGSRHFGPKHAARLGGCECSTKGGEVVPSCHSDVAQRPASCELPRPSSPRLEAHSSRRWRSLTATSSRS